MIFLYKYEWDIETGGYNLISKVTGAQQEIRPVFFEELKFLQLDKKFGWKIPESVDIAAMIQKNKNMLNGLIQRILNDIYAVFKSHKKSTDIFYVAFSGGKIT